LVFIDSYIELYIVQF